METAKLSVENEKLRKMVKELQKGDGNKKYYDEKAMGIKDEGFIYKENEMLKKKISEIEKEKQKIADELIKIRVN